MLSNGIFSALNKNKKLKSIWTNSWKQTLVSYSATREREWKSEREKSVSYLFIYTEFSTFIEQKKTQNMDDNTCANTRYV